MDTVKIAAIGSDPSVLIFNAAGIDTHIADNATEAKRAIKQYIKENYMIIFVCEEFMTALADETDNYNSSAFPIIIPIPQKRDSVGYSRDKIIRCCERALGINIFDKK